MDHQISAGKTGAALGGSGKILIGQSLNAFYKGIFMKLLYLDVAISDEQLARISYYLARKWNLDIDSDADGIMDDEDIDLNGVDFNKPPVFIPHHL